MEEPAMMEAAVMEEEMPVSAECKPLEVATSKTVMEGKMTAADAADVWGEMTATKAAEMGSEMSATAPTKAADLWGKVSATASEMAATAEMAAASEVAASAGAT